MKPALPDISPQAASASAHSTHSSLREQAIGHIFLGQLLTFMWRNDHRDIEVLKSEVDRGGYDLVLESGGVIRHVQLKSRFRGSRVGSIDASTKLLAKPGGCIIWIEFDPDTLLPERYYWFGMSPENRCPVWVRRSRVNPGAMQMVTKRSDHSIGSSTRAISGQPPISPKSRITCLELA